MAPELQAFDHIHVHVADRAKAEEWYEQILGLRRTKELEFWAEDGGPLTLQNRSGSIHIALFQRAAHSRHSVVALRVGAGEYLEWVSHLEAGLEGQVTEEDHIASRSLYFADPDGNPYEITTYEVAELAEMCKA